MEESRRYSFTSVHLEPKEQIGLHRQSTWELSYVVTGSGMRLVGDTSEPFHSGEVVLIPPGIPHCWYFDSAEVDNRGRIANITITFAPSLLDDLQRVFPELAATADVLKGRHEAVKLKGSTVSEVIDLMQSMRDMGAAERIAPLVRVIQMLAHEQDERVIGSYCAADKEQERMSQIKTYSICNFKRKITLEDVARHVGMNSSAFCVFFRRVTGTTYTAYLNGLRLDVACSLLKDKRTAISDVCFEAGFNDVPYFNRIFKKLTGLSPKAYRDGL